MNYESLKKAIVDFPDLVGEADLEAYVQTIIELAEARINRDVRLRGHLRSQYVSGTLSEHPLPADYLDLDRLTGPNGEALEVRPADELERIGTPPSGPRFYAIDGTRLIFVPEISGMRLFYYQKPAPLRSAPGGTNWLLDKAPDLYLYAGLCEAARFSKESEQEYTRFEQAYARIAGALIQSDAESRLPRSSPIRSIPRTGRRASTI